MNKRICTVEKLCPGAYQCRSIINSFPSLLPCAAMSHARRAGAALPGGAQHHPGHATPFPAWSEETLSRRGARPGPTRTCAFTSPRPGRARRVALRRVPGAAQCAPPSDLPVPAPPPPPPTRESNGDAHARHRRCTGAGSRAPMHARVQQCSFPTHAHFCCSRRRRAEQRALPLPCSARPPPAPRTHSAVPVPAAAPAPAPAPAAANAAAAVDSKQERALGANATSPRRTRRAAMQMTSLSPPLSRLAPPPPWAQGPAVGGCSGTGQSQGRPSWWHANKPP